MSYVIEPLTKSELLEIFDEEAKSVIRYYLIKAVFAQPEILPGQSPLPVQIPKEHIEQWFTQALGVTPVGAGSYPIDIYNDKEGWGADIKMLSIKTTESGEMTRGASGEASLGQNFKEAGIDLDDLFKRRDFETIKDRWVKLYTDKFASVERKFPINKYLYLFILRSGANFHLVGANIHLDNLKEVEVDYKKSTASSVFVSNFIDIDLGNTKVYKAKKRLELRLKPKKWVELGYSIKFETDFLAIEADIRKLCANPDLLDLELDRLKKIQINIS